MNENRTKLRDVTTAEMQDVDGGWCLLNSLVIIMTAEQQRSAGGGPQPTLVHEPKHQ